MHMVLRAITPFFLFKWYIFFPELYAPLASVFEIILELESEESYSKEESDYKYIHEL